MSKFTTAKPDSSAAVAEFVAKGGKINKVPTSAKATPAKPVAQTKPAKPTKATPAKADPKPANEGRALALANVAAKAESGVGVTLHSSGKPIKGLAAEPVVAKPQRKMLRVIDKIIGHPGKGNCVHRFHLYHEGMTLLDAKVTEGLIPSDVTFYAECGYLTLRDPTDAEYEAAVAKWEADKAAAAKAA